MLLQRSGEPHLRRCESHRSPGCSEPMVVVICYAHHTLSLSALTHHTTTHPHTTHTHTHTHACILTHIACTRAYNCCQMLLIVYNTHTALHTFYTHIHIYTLYTHHTHKHAHIHFMHAQCHQSIHNCVQCGWTDQVLGRCPGNTALGNSFRIQRPFGVRP